MKFKFNTHQLRRRQISIRLSEDLIDYAEREALIRSARPPYKECTLSDIIRIALTHLRNTAAAEIPKARSQCKIIIAGDSSFCATCGLRWDTNDSNPPVCPKK